MIRRGLAAAALIFALPALAQVVPDAGSQLRDAEKKPPALPRKPPPKPAVEPARPATEAPAGVQFRLRDFRFSGNTAYHATFLRWLISPYLGRDVGYAELQEAATRITTYYREHGYLVARAYLPQQEIRDGVVEIAILEGRLGRIDQENASRVRNRVIQSHLEPLAGEVIREDNVERKLLLVSDLSGVAAQSAALSPGDRVGESAITLALKGPNAFSAGFEFDNYGSYHSGEYRLSAELEYASPTGFGDQLRLRATKGMPGLELVQLGYQLPLGGDGLRVGLSYSGLHYELGKDFAALEANGHAHAVTGALSYPFVRTRTFNITGLAAATRRTFEDRLDALSTVTNKSSNVGTGGLSGDWRDGLGEGAVNTWALTYSGGRLEIETPTALALDQATLKTDGAFQKLNWNFMRAQRLAERAALVLTLSGQRADKNLDSSEKFTLGGPYGVRAFPLGEGSGDQGILGSLELRYDLFPGSLQAIAFGDAGEVKINKDPLPGTSGNERSLSALGFGVNWMPVRGLTARAAVAWGNERALSAPDREPRGWIQVVYRL